MKAIYYFSSSVTSHKETMWCYYVNFITDIYFNLTVMEVTQMIDYIYVLLIFKCHIETLQFLALLILEILFWVHS